MSEYPECEKMLAIKDRSQTCGELLDWLQAEKGAVLCVRDSNDTLWPMIFQTEELLAEFFGVDLDKVEQEKRAMLAEYKEAKHV